MPSSYRPFLDRITVAMNRLRSMIDEGIATLWNLQRIHSDLTAQIEADEAPAAVWISPHELAGLSMSGAAWDVLERDARRDPGEPDIADQHSHHDVYTMAAALVAARTRSEEKLDQAVARIEAAIGTEKRTPWLEIGRNLGAYVIAADLIRGTGYGLPARITDWIAAWPTREMPDNLPPHEPRGWRPFGSGSNASCQEGFALAAVGAFLADRAVLDTVWERFRVFVGDASGEINLKTGINGGWAHDRDNPTAIVPKGLLRDGKRLDGAIINDMARGADYKWPPVWTQYPWVGLEGLVPCALVLDRAGYPAFDVGDRAVLRCLEYLKYLRDETGEVLWADGKRAREVIALVNHAYGTAFPMSGPAGKGRTFGWSSWSHP